MSVAEATEPTAVTDEVNTTAEVPASPDATSAPGGAGEEPAGTGTEPTASDRARDEKGRFARQEKAEGETDVAVRGEPTSPVPPTDQPTAPPAEPQFQVKGEPFTFRAEGQRIPLQGAVLTPEGALAVPPEQVPVIRQLLAEGVAHRTTWRQRESEYKQQIEQAPAVEKARADRIEAVAVRMFEALTNGDWLTAAAADPREVNYFIRELGIELQRAKLEAPRAPENKQVEQAPDPQVIETAARHTLREYVEELLERPQAKAIYDTPEKRDALEKRLQRRLAAYFTELEDGSIALHENAVDEDFNDELNERLTARETADKARKAAEFNAKRNAPAPTLPPVVSTKAPPATAPSTNSYKDRDEWRRKNGLV